MHYRKEIRRAREKRTFIDLPSRSRCAKIVNLPCEKEIHIKDKDGEQYIHCVHKVFVARKPSLVGQRTHTLSHNTHHFILGVEGWRQTVNNTKIFARISNELRKTVGKKRRDKGIRKKTQRK
jgi:hypothetical protein